MLVIKQLVIASPYLISEDFHQIKASLFMNMDLDATES